MNDFNFFSPYSNNRKEGDKKEIFIGLTILVATFIIVSLVWNTANIFILESKISTLNKKINDETLQAQLKESEAVAKKNDELKNLNTDLNDVYKYINSRALVKSDFMIKVSSTLPAGLSLKTITVDGSNVQIQAVSKNRVSIGEIEYNLKNIDGIKDVYVSNINSDLAASDAQFNFSIKCVLKDVDNNENK